MGFDERSEERTKNYESARAGGKQRRRPAHARGIAEAGRNPPRDAVAVRARGGTHRDAVAAMALFWDAVPIPERVQARPV